MSTLKNWIAVKHPFYFFGLGLLSALGFAPFFAWPLTWVAFYFFFRDSRTIEPANLRSLFWRGWAFGFGHFLVGLYWIALSLHVDWMRFGILFPIAVTGYPALFACGPATGVIAMHLVRASKGMQWAVFALVWSLWEVLRGKIVMSFPWLLLGDVWLNSIWVLQSFSVVGPFAMSLLTVLLFTAPTVFRVRGTALSLALFVGAAGWGLLRLVSPTLYHEDIEVAVIQPNISQKYKWQSELIPQHLENIYQLTRDIPRRAKSMVIVWPETVVPFSVQSGGHFAKQLGNLLRPTDYIAFGAIRLDRTMTPAKYYNSLVVLDHTGAILANHDKHILAAFGEYVPFRKYIPKIVTDLTGSLSDFDKGPGPSDLKLPGIPTFSPLICYEVIFTGKVRPKGTYSPTQWMMAITNDGWFLNSSGPSQHFYMARARAVEEGLPLIRAANTGVSAIIDPYGRILEKIPYGERGRLVSYLPKPLPGATLYHQYGERFYAMIIVLLVALVLALKIISRIHENNNRESS